MPSNRRIKGGILHRFAKRARLAILSMAVVAAAYAAAAGPAAARPTGERHGVQCAVSADTGSGLYDSARGTALREPATADVAKDVPLSARNAAGARFSASVPVYFHVVTDGTNGDVSDRTINQQIQVLNQTYNASRGGVPSGFRFFVAGVDHTVKPAWYGANPGDPAEVAMKRALHQGGSDTLNVYTTSGGDYLGWATFPSSFANHPWYDGIVIDYRSMPGGAYGTRFSLGFTLTHEAGHWFGLYHTFQGACGGLGDHVGDTPAEAKPNFGNCPDDRDTCPDKPGFDPVHNYMDYSFDRCYEEFTGGQVSRMQDQWLYYRT